MDKDKKVDITSEEYINKTLKEASEDNATGVSLIVQAVKRIFKKRSKKK